ncbi:phage virion morphogenesis protein [Roseibium litorale]|uniref:Phage virion morphogenesis protein n=1 Tax=Roseibium litorale TaxID=2803841 RepID=A0ABR9CH04_9HYPH|nr:phage virion morphogenesis protein [Roseibium litorale]MBD8890152.1 phage virion morphogenesis protein [Roseibium litorale]
MNVTGLSIADEAIQAALDKVAAKGGDTAPMMADIEGAMLFDVQRRFETETDPAGQSWQRMSKRTAASRARRKRRKADDETPVTPKLLRDTNRLYSSIQGHSGEGFAEVGTNLAYARIHQEGGVIEQYPHSRKVRFRKVEGRILFARKAHKRAFEKPVTYGARTITIPARPYLGFSDAVRAKILGIIEEHFGEGLQ